MERPEPDCPSEVNIVLLGRVGAGKSASGNTILGGNVFESELAFKCKTTQSKEATAHISERLVTVLDTPGLFDTTYGIERNEDVRGKVQEFLARGRCVFLIVVELGQFTEEAEKSIEKICEFFPHEPLRKFMILFTYGDKLKGKPLEDILKEADDKVNKLLNKFHNRYHVFNNISAPNNTQVVELLEKIDGMLMARESGNGQEMTEVDLGDLEAIVDAGLQNINIPLLLAWEGDKTTPEPLRLVLLGRTGTGKSATGNTILDMDGFESHWGLSSVTTRCQREEGMVCGRTVSVVDTPGFFGTAGSEKEIREEVVKSVCLSAPGPHAFVLVLSLKERLTAETKDTIKELHKRFGKDFKDHTIILFSHLDALGQNKTFEDVINQINSDTELRKLFSPFENRIHAFDNNNRSNRDQVRELLEKVDRMAQDSGCYTDEMYRIANEKIWEMVWRIFKKCIEWIRRRVEPLLEGMQHGTEQARERIQARFRVYIQKIITSTSSCHQEVNWVLRTHRLQSVFQLECSMGLY